MGLGFEVEALVGIPGRVEGWIGFSMSLKALETERELWRYWWRIYWRVTTGVVGLLWWIYRVLPC